jgi:hypothetical protein
MSTISIGCALCMGRKMIAGANYGSTNMQYQKYELKQPKPLLREILDKNFESERRGAKNSHGACAGRRVGDGLG